MWYHREKFNNVWVNSTKFHQHQETRLTTKYFILLWSSLFTSVVSGLQAVDEQCRCAMMSRWKHLQCQPLVKIFYAEHVKISVVHKNNSWKTDCQDICWGYWFKRNILEYCNPSFGGTLRLILLMNIWQCINVKCSVNLSKFRLLLKSVCEASKLCMYDIRL